MSSPNLHSGKKKRKRNQCWPVDFTLSKKKKARKRAHRTGGPLPERSALYKTSRKGPAPRGEAAFASPPLSRRSDPEASASAPDNFGGGGEDGGGPGGRRGGAQLSPCPSYGLNKSSFSPPPCPRPPCPHDGSKSPVFLSRPQYAPRSVQRLLLSLKDLREAIQLALLSLCSPGDMCTSLVRVMAINCSHLVTLDMTYLLGG